MEFDKLVEAELDNSIKPVVQKLLEQKKITSELGMGNRIVALNDYIDNQIKCLANIANTLPDKRNDWDELNDYFIKILDKQVGIKQDEKQM